MHPQRTSYSLTFEYNYFIITYDCCRNRKFTDVLWLRFECSSAVFRCLFRLKTKNHQRSTLLVFCEEYHRLQVDSSNKGTVMWKVVSINFAAHKYIKMNNEDIAKVFAYNTVGGCFKLMIHAKLTDIGNWLRLLGPLLLTWCNFNLSMGM